MNLKPYTPQAGSLAALVVGFFTNNRDENLTLDDIAEKFVCTRGNIHTILRSAVESGLLERGKNDDGEYIYQRGPKAPAAPGVDIDQVHQPRQCVPVGKRTRNTPSGYTSVRKLLDVAALKVEDHVPYMPTARKAASKWDALFDKLTMPGQSVAIPGDCKSALAAAAHMRNKKKAGTFQVAMTGADEARVWRIA